MRPKQQRKTVISYKQRSENIYLGKKLPGKEVQIRKYHFRTADRVESEEKQGMTQVM